MSTRYDVIVVGAGHNGLTAAARLAKSGRKVLLLERRDAVGGLAAEEELAEGYRVPGVLHDTSGVRVAVLDSLGLLSGKDALALRDDVPGRLVLGGDEPFVLHRDPEQASAELRSVSKRDAEAYRSFRDFLFRVRKAIEPVLNAPPPDPTNLDSLGAQWQIVRSALKVRMLGRRDMMELLRALPMSLRDYLEDHFESEPLKAGLALPALEGVWGGPWSPGTTTSLVLHDVVAGPGIHGGASKLVKALESACKRFGVEIQTGKTVERVRVSQGTVVGVTLDDGETFDAPVAVCSGSPKTALTTLLPPRALPLRVEGQALNIRTRGVVAKIDLALDGTLAMASHGDERHGVLQIGATLSKLEKAFDPTKYGRVADELVLDVYVPTVEDQDLAPDGCDVISVHARGVPHALEGGWTDEAREAIGDAVVEQLGCGDQVVARRVRTPADLEAEFGAPGGQLHHGESALDQLLPFRPIMSCSRYSTPVHGVFLASSGSHPGGGITCAPGALAADAVLQGR